MRHELPTTFSEFREVLGHQLDFSAEGVSYDIAYLIAGNISKARLQLYVWTSVSYSYSGESLALIPQLLSRVTLCPQATYRPSDSPAI